MSLANTHAPQQNNAEHSNSDRSSVVSRNPFFNPKQTFFQPRESIQRKCEECEKEDVAQRQPMEEEEELQMKSMEEEDELQMKAVKEVRTKKSVSPQNGKTSSAIGKKLPSNIRAKAEQVLQTGFSNVKMHESAEASNIGALAYTQGNSITFAPGMFQPNTREGEKLIGHELTHVKQQREGRVKPTTTKRGYNINNEKNLENEADNFSEKIVQAKAMDNSEVKLSGKKENNNEGNVKQLALPAVIAGMGAAEWIAAGSLGYSMARDVVTHSGDPDVKYKLDEMEGSLVPVEDNDVNKYNEENRGRTVYEGTHYLTLWYGYSGGTKMAGIKIAITFLYDGQALGSISMGIVEVYDWPMWSGSFDLNITPRGLASRGMASVRLTINMTADKSVWSYEGHKIFNLRGNGDLSYNSGAGVPGYHSIG